MMDFLAVLVVLLILVFIVLPRLRLRYILRKAFPSNYSKILRKNLPGYSKMPTDLQLQLKRRIKQFLHEKTFVACDDLAMTDEVKVTIAGKACLLLLNRETEVFPKLTHILVYPHPFVAPRQQTAAGGVVTHTNQGLSGESWSDGRVILAWDQVARNPVTEALGQDVTLHEFAHQLDSETGSTNGAPVLKTAAAYQRWSQVMATEFTALQHAIQHQEDTIIDTYGATNPAEFFAVCTEAFFKKSEALAHYHPALYTQLQSFYQVDPREWV
jgi:Mlc titration factor MtfA (ptsG expression regulator)